MASPPSQTFIGRQQEMARLLGCWDEAVSGRGQIALLAGEPGIGKTTVAQQLADHASAQGALVLWGWCYEHAGAPPYWPYVQPIRTYLQTADPNDLRAQMGAGSSDIAQIIPELSGILGDLPSAPSLEPAQARFRFFDSLAAFLRNCSTSRPLVLVLDDLHWADGSSLLLLEFLAREIASSRVLIVGTYRDDEVTGAHPFAQVLGGLVRLPYFHRVQLGGLTEPEVGEFVAAKSGTTVSADVAATMHWRTDGNPLFVSEVVGLFNPQEITGDSAWADELPLAVRETIVRRLGRLSEACNLVLRMASVIGRDFEYSLLNELTPGLEEDEFVAALDEALDARLVESLPLGVGYYRFGHALIQEAIYDDISQVRRAREHGKIAETIVRIYSVDLEEHAPILAHHFGLAGGMDSLQRVVRYSLVAGERALEVYAHEEALGHFKNGLVARGVEPEGSMPAPDDQSAALVFGLGRAEAATAGNSVSKATEAIRNLKRAFDHYRQTGQPDRALEVAKYPVRTRSGFRIGMEDLLGPAVELAKPESPDAARLLSNYGRVLGLEQARYDEAQEAFNRALRIAEQSDDVSLEIGVLADAATVHFFHAHRPEALQASLRAIGLSAQADEPRAQLAARYIAVLTQVAMGDLQDASENASAMLPVAEKVRDHFWLDQAHWMGEKVSTMRGDWRAARSFNDAGLAISPGSPTLLSTRIILEYQLGQFDDGARFLERLLEGAEAAPAWPIFDHVAVASTIPNIARITGVMERFDIAEKSAEIAISSPHVIPAFSMTAQSGLVLIAVMRRDRSACEELYRIAADQGYYHYPIVGGRLLGLLARTMGNLDKAVEHFEDALAFCRTRGYRPELAWTCRDYGESLMMSAGRDRAPSSEIRAKLDSLLGVALSVATELGMLPLIEQVKTLQQQGGATPAREEPYPDGLSQREVEVLRLICGGKTDREIGEELIISIRTVGHHVSNILNKTGAANRTEAAGYAAARGLNTDSN